VEGADAVFTSRLYKVGNNKSRVREPLGRQVRVTRAVLDPPNDSGVDRLV